MKLGAGSSTLPQLGAGATFWEVFRAASWVFARAWRWWLPPAVALLVVGQFVSLSINVTPSVPQRAFLVLKYDREVGRGDFVAFYHPGGGPFPSGAPVVKIVTGVAGDVVEASGREMRVNGRPMGEAKAFTRAGMPLALGPTGEIPPGFLYVHTPHPDSADSRYALTGWVHVSRIRGRAIPLF